jgi:lysophospholipase L1-like esterase
VGKGGIGISIRHDPPWPTLHVANRRPRLDLRAQVLIANGFFVRQVFCMSGRCRGFSAAIGLIAVIGATSPLLAQAIAPASSGPPAVIEAMPLEAPLAIEPAADVAITWSVVSRFRLFRDERDFHRHADAMQGRTVLEAEQVLATATDGRGWARDTVGRLCLDSAGLIEDPCVRDGVRENYLDPVDHPVEVRLVGALPATATCTWTFDTEGDAVSRTANADCAAPMKVRVREGRPTRVTADLAVPGKAVRRATADIAVRDLLIAGLGDSIASGDGNPDRPIALADDGFCFRRFATGGRAEYFRPSRVGFSGDRACDGDIGGGGGAEWARLSAHWMNGACHRSLYGYQLRAALALAVENPHIAVTFLPLACTGATIADGLFNGQHSRELVCGADGVACPPTTPAQIPQLRALMARTQRGRLDLVFLTIGANDINFAGLVADIIIEGRTERALLSRAGIISSIDAAQATLDTRLPADFARLREALKPLVAGGMERVVYTSYGNPALSPDTGPCPGGRSGFDIHPAFGVDGERLRRTVAFVQDRFLPALKAVATCSHGGCPAADAMTFVDDHQAAFASHGFCVRADTDPPFDRECFRADGTSFSESPIAGATDPVVCNASVSEFRVYASRARWIRTPNDAYFAAMTFPEGVSALIRPSSLHDATWGVLSAVYGGAIHPSAEGHAAMADAALAGAKSALGLVASNDPIIAEPLPALPAAAR